MQVGTCSSLLFTALIAACAVASQPVLAQLQPITIGSSDEPTDTGPTVCERDFDMDELGLYFRQLILPLCKRGDSDSLLAAYLYSIPGFGPSNGKFEDRILQRAYVQQISDPKLLWLVATQSDCAGALGGCKSAQEAIKAAQALTMADPDNAIAWFALARARDLAMDLRENVDSALDRAAKAGHVHDYTFDLFKLVVKKSAGATLSTGESTDEIRWLSMYMVSMLNLRYIHWGCRFQFSEIDPDRSKFCDAAEQRLKSGDSLLVLGNDKAFAAIKTKVNPPPGVTVEQLHRIMIQTIGDSSSEGEWYSKIAERLKSKQSSK